MVEPVCLSDFETLAREKLSAATYEFIAGGAADEITLRWNRDAFDRIRLRPRVLTDVSAINMRISLFQTEMPSPILLAPVAYQRLMDPRGELAVAEAAAATGTTYVVSTASNYTIEEIASVPGAVLWLQVYVQSDRAYTRDLIARAEASGIRALCLTVDTPVLGTRNRQKRAAFTIPPELPTPHLDAAGRERLSIVGGTREPITWSDIDTLRAQTKLPLLAKGILDPADAERAVAHGIDGIIVSNHGARNLDTVPATIDALPAVAERISGRVPILVDGGIRRGTDVVKALALGASAVLIGRPYLYALAAGGAEAVAHAINILREELETAMALLGRSDVATVDRSVLWESPPQSMNR